MWGMDRVDYVQVTMHERNPCRQPAANGCVDFAGHLSNDHLRTNYGGIDIMLNGLRHDNDADDNSDLHLARTIAHELFHVLGMRDEYIDKKCNKQPASENVPSLMHCRGSTVEKPLVKDYDRAHIARVYRPAGVTSLDAAPMIEDVGLGNVQFRLNALPVKVDNGIEIRRKEGGTWGRAFPTWGAAETELRVTLAGQPLGTLTYGIFRRTAVLVGEQEVIPAGPIPRGESSDADQGGADGQATRGTGSEAIGFLQSLTVTRLADQR